MNTTSPDAASGPLPVPSFTRTRSSGCTPHTVTRVQTSDLSARYAAILSGKFGRKVGAAEATRLALAAALKGEGIEVR